ncbi:hypothetical protein [Halonotius sp. GCM10025705]|uniref:hypothetical protein n=1 Tax=Halonotius sp. GCM10025705 TaxID=3252678 RepID=UPI003605E69C
MEATWHRDSAVGRLTMTLPIAVIALTIPVGLFLEELPRAIRFAPFVVSVGLFGLPHGAVDHLMPVRLSDASLKRSLGSSALSTPSWVGCISRSGRSRRLSRWWRFSG